jgi:dTDP-4-amino-4,6-dideoxygalactose transaminase
MARLLKTRLMSPRLRQGHILAVCGGTPAFERPLHVGAPNLGDRKRFIERVNDVLDRRWLTNDGAYVREFEAAVADLHSVRHCVATSSGTVGLELAVRATRMRGEVILPSFTFIATAHAVAWQGFVPNFCDIEPIGHHIDPALAERMVTHKTGGVIAVHIWGRPSDAVALESLCQSRQIPLVFDAAHAFGCSLGERMIGGFGDCEVLSFHATKVLNTLEGGAVLTNSDELAERLRLMRNFGFRGLDDVGYIGTNGKMNELAAAMGLTVLEDLDRILAVNRANDECYRTALADVPGLAFLPYEPKQRRNHQYVVTLVKPGASLTRDELMAVLHAENVLARRYFYPGCHRMEPYVSSTRRAADQLPVTDAVANQVLALPTGTAVSTDDVEMVSDIIRLALDRPDQVRRSLRASAARTSSALVGEENARPPRPGV